MTCPACGGTLTPWLSVPGGEPGDPRTFPLSRCSSCGSAVTGGEPPGASAYSTGVYADDPPRAAGVVRTVQRLTDRQAVGLVSGPRVLDVGAGRGRLVAALRRAGFDASGIDPSGRGDLVERRTIEEVSETDLDAVVLWHVLEHLDDPFAALGRVRGWLRPGGSVVVAAPNLASWQARIAGPDWLHFDAPRHRVHFTATGLEALLSRSGFTVQRTVHMVWEHNPTSMWMALLTRLGMTPNFPFHLLKRNVPARPRDLALLTLGIPLAPLALALEAAAASRRRGGTVAVVAMRS